MGGTLLENALALLIAELLAILAVNELWGLKGRNENAMYEKNGSGMHIIAFSQEKMDKAQRTHTHIGALLGLLLGLLVGVTLVGPGVIIGRTVHEIIVVVLAAIPSLQLVLAGLHGGHLGGTLGLFLGLASFLLLLLSLAASLHIVGYSTKTTNQKIK